jgi:hypothetical protein
LGKRATLVDTASISMTDAVAIMTGSLAVSTPD